MGRINNFELVGYPQDGRGESVFTGDIQTSDWEGGSGLELKPTILEDIEDIAAGGYEPLPTVGDEQ